MSKKFNKGEGETPMRRRYGQPPRRSSSDHRISFFSDLFSKGREKSFSL